MDIIWRVTHFFLHTIGHVTARQERREKPFSAGEIHKRLARTSRFGRFFFIVKSHRSVCLARRTGVDGNDVVALG